MDLVTIVHEIFRFLKDYFFKILLGAVLVSVVAVGLRYYRSDFDSKEVKEAYGSLLTRYEQEPAEFQFVVTKPDGTLFNNSFIFDEYFSQTEQVTHVENVTGIKFAEWLVEENILELQKSNTFRGGLAALRVPSADVITLRVLVGKTSEDNLKIAQAYQKLLENSELPFLKGNTVTILNEASLIERLPLDQFPTLANASSLSQISNLTPRSMVIFGVAGLIAGFLLTAVLLFVLRLFKKEIVYAFDYTWDMDDMHLIYRRKNNESNTNLQDLITIPELAHRYVIIQGDPNNLLPVEDQRNTKCVTKVQDIKTEVQEIVLVIYSLQTTKAWYNHQYQLAKLYRVPVKIIHVS